MWVRPPAWLLGATLLFLTYIGAVAGAALELDNSNTLLCTTVIVFAATAGLGVGLLALRGETAERKREADERKREAEERKREAAKRPPGGSAR